MRILLQTFRSFFAHVQIERAGYMAFTAFLAFFPFMIFLASLASFIGRDDWAQRGLGEVWDILPPSVAETLRPIIDSLLGQQQGGLLTIGILFTLWIISSGIEATRLGLDAAYDTYERRPLWKRRLQSIGLVFLAAAVQLLLTLLIILAPALWAWLAQLTDLPMRMPTLLEFLRYLAALLLLVGVITTLYDWLPNHRSPVRWSCHLPGALLAALLWLLMATAIAFYLQYTPRYNELYGPIAGIIVTMLFLHYSSMLILLGAELNAALLHKRGELPS